MSPPPFLGPLPLPHARVQWLSIGRTDYGKYVKNLLQEGISPPRGGVDVGDHPPITPMKSAVESDLFGSSAWKYAGLRCPLPMYSRPMLGPRAPLVWSAEGPSLMPQDTERMANARGESHFVWGMLRVEISLSELVFQKDHSKSRAASKICRAVRPTFWRW